jgi:hypothetical protein
MLFVCLSPPVELLNQLADFQETPYQYYAIEAHPNFVQLVNNVRANGIF